jgi:hypothetical protein
MCSGLWARCWWRWSAPFGDQGRASRVHHGTAQVSVAARSRTAIGLWQRAWIFLRRAGTIIFMVTVMLWLLLNFPRAEPGEDQIDASVAGSLPTALPWWSSRSVSTATSRCR